MQPNHQHPDDVVLDFDDRCQNYDLYPLVSYSAKVCCEISGTSKCTRGGHTDKKEV